MKLMKVAIIDDGICINLVKNYRNIKHYCIKENIIIEENISIQKITHGTICAFFLTQIAENLELYDIQIFTAKKAFVEDVIIALEWCLQHSISIINMSFGTLNYLDYKKMEPILQKLINRGIYIVSAHNNYNIWSYPAVCNKVFGVRKDTGKSLKNEEFGYQLCNGLHIENSFIAHYNNTKISDMTSLTNGNSYAAPIITGHIAKFLFLNPYVNYKDVLDFLIRESKPQKCIGNNLQKKIPFLSLSITTPIIAFQLKDILVYKQIKNMFVNNGYQEVSFIDSLNESLSIPFNLYCNNKELLTQDIISTLDFIYDADIFILCLYEYRYSLNNILELVDLFITINKNNYCIMDSNSVFECHDITSMYKFIIEYFESEK